MSGQISFIVDVTDLWTNPSMVEIANWKRYYVYKISTSHPLEQVKLFYLLIGILDGAASQQKKEL